MKRPSYLSNHLIDWDTLDVVASGKSSLDSKFFTNSMINEVEIKEFLAGYGFDVENPVEKAELFGNFQEAVQFIKRYFLKEGSPDGLDLVIPNSILMTSNIVDLFLIATGNSEHSVEESLWAEIILKVVHTILHLDRDLRSNYLSTIQTQIFDRFYKHISRDKNENLTLGRRNTGQKISIVNFETKSRKTRDSVIIKLLHKAENVAEELFDRIGVRIITKSRFDTIRVLKYLIEEYVIIPHNIKPSRSLNSLINLKKLKSEYLKLIKDSIREQISEEDFLSRANELALSCSAERKDGNKYSLDEYQSIQFTCRQLIKYKNPFFHQFSDLRKLARSKDEKNDLIESILEMDISLISQDVRFFYPFEVQVVDEEAHRINTEGEASHDEYKKQQTQAAMKRVMSPLLKFKKLI